MNGTCQCGGRITERSHEVTTEHGALEYGIKQYPVKVEISKCKSCNRAMTKFYLIGGNEIIKGK